MSAQSDNLERIRERLMPLKALGDGLIHKRTTAEYQILLLKQAGQVQLYFATPSVDASELDVSGIMSRVDVEAPLRLLGIYTQAMILSLLWKPEPRRVYLMGFGGGRIPMVLHHYYPELVIDSTEVDGTVLDLAKRFFGIALDHRMRVFVEDGRSYLERSDPSVRYDFILVDCFTGAGVHPYPFSTVEFYAECKRHLSEGGVLVSNLASDDVLFGRKIRTLAECFRYVWRFGHPRGAHVVFGSDADLSREEMTRRAESLFDRCQFEFPFRELVQYLRPFSAAERNCGPPLSDHALESPVPRQETTFLGARRNDTCPCGSGRKFKKCHGK